MINWKYRGFVLLERFSNCYHIPKRGKYNAPPGLAVGRVWQQVARNIE